MTAIITNSQRVEAAKLFKTIVDTKYNSLGVEIPENLYTFIGRPQSWSTDLTPPTPTRTRQLLAEAWNDMMALKKVKPTDVVHVVPRFNWTEGTTYAYWDQDSATLFNSTGHPLYCVTDDYSVYKCIGNGYHPTLYPSGRPSTLAPSGTNPSQIIEHDPDTEDGYRWKFLFQLSRYDVNSYVTPDWIPVKTLTADDGSLQWQVQAAAVDGAIQHAVLQAAGSGYTKTYTGMATDDSTRVAVKLTGDVLGAGEYVNSGLYITSGPGAGQCSKITAWDGTTATVSFSGSLPAPTAASYVKILPYIDLIGNGSGAVLMPVISGGVFQSVTVMAGGAGYSMATCDTLTGVTGGGGTGAIVKPITSPQGGHGSDPVEELFGNTVMVVSVYSPSEGAGDFPTDNDYRRIGLIHNVRAAGGDWPSSDSMRASGRLTTNGNNSVFAPDTTITSSGGASAKVIQAGGLNNNNFIHYYQDSTTGFGTFHTTETLSGEGTAQTRTISAVDVPEAQHNTGEMLWVEHRRPIQRATDQMEDMRILLVF